MKKAEGRRRRGSSEGYPTLYLRVGVEERRWWEGGASSPEKKPVRPGAKGWLGKAARPAVWEVEGRTMWRGGHESAASHGRRQQAAWLVVVGGGRKKKKTDAAAI